MSHTLSRRRLLKTVFCSSAAMALNIRSDASAAPATRVAGDKHLFMLGDFGSGEPSQTAVANGMAARVKSLGITPEWLMLLGDNFYKNAKLGGGLSEARWKSGFEDMYPASVFPNKCPAVLGNHDYHDTAGGQKMQLAYAAEGGTRWTMPAKWYRMEFGTLATFLFIDTNLRSISSAPDPKDKEKKVKPSLTAEEEAAQWAWLKDQLASKRAQYTIVVGHHPVYSNGVHGDSKELVTTLAPMLQANSVHLYLCGHDHDMQHLELEGLKTSFVLSGGGGARVRDLPNKLNRTMPYGTAIFGFSHLEFNDKRILVRHLDANGKSIHAFEKNLDFSWKEVA